VSGRRVAAKGETIGRWNLSHLTHLEGRGAEDAWCAPPGGCPEEPRG